MARLDYATSSEVADEAGLVERYVREWLGAMVTGGIVEYDPTRCAYRLPKEHARLLTRDAKPSNAAAVALGEEPSTPPRTTAIGALAYYVSHADPRTYQPTNITFGIMPAPAPSPGQKKLKKVDRKTVTSERALADLEEWLGERAAPVLP